MLFKDSGIESNAPATEEEIQRFHWLLKKYFDEENFVDAEKMTTRILEADPEDKIANEYFDVLCQMKKRFPGRTGDPGKIHGEGVYRSCPTSCHGHWRQCISRV